MYRRSLTLVAALATVLILVPAALAVRVHVRVEGKTQTIFGATEPTLNVKANALDALESASLAGEFFYHVTDKGFGPYVDQIGRYAAAGSSGWLYKLNGILPPVGPNSVQLHDGDTVLWYWGTFNGPVGPLTLEVETSIAHGKRCFFATGRNDAGHTSRMRNVVFVLNGRRLRSRTGIVCTTAGRYAVRVTKPGAVRSRIYIGQ
ncbi:MAG TPA: DUF4430 domain-containing protein [Gaiellaceae bacterium]|nr:DUF4430 domain-containing protein [Gaiellaceae bacterium]